MRMVGSALGNIIATIIAAHIRKISRRYCSSQVASIIQAAAASISPYISNDAGTRYAHAQAITPARPAITKTLSVRREAFAISRRSRVAQLQLDSEITSILASVTFAADGRLSWPTFRIGASRVSGSMFVAARSRARVHGPSRLTTNT